MKSSINRLHNTTNPYQGSYKRVLCLCSAGLLRSPTAAHVLSQEPYNYNTRAAGCATEYALVPVDEALVVWAQEIVCMTEEQRDFLVTHPILAGALEGRPIITLDIPDRFNYRDPELVELIHAKYAASRGD